MRISRNSYFEILKVKITILSHSNLFHNCSRPSTISNNPQSLTSLRWLELIREGGGAMTLKEVNFDELELEPV
jgi:hypothetical protein